MTTILLTTTFTITILFLMGLALKLAGYEDTQTKKMREDIDAIMERLGLGKDNDAEEKEDVQDDIH